MKASALRKTLVVLLAAVATSVVFPVYASSFAISRTTSGSTTTFTVTRSGAGTDAPETVFARAVSRSALAGAHFIASARRLDFAAGETAKEFTVSAMTAAQFPNTTFLYYQSGGATGASRTYRFEVTDAGGFLLASVDRTISYDSSRSVSTSAFNEKSVTVIGSTAVTVTDNGYNQAFHLVPIDTYFSGLPREYLSHSGARLNMFVNLQAAEDYDGYQYIQVLADQPSTVYDTGADGGNPGTIRYSRYMAGFEHKNGSKDSTFMNYSFPVVNTTVTLPWSELGNEIGSLHMQRFNAALDPQSRATDGRLSVPASISSLVIRFDASGSDKDDWKVKNVAANIQAVPSGLSLVVNPIVTEQPVAKGSSVSVSLPFNEIAVVTGTPVLNTTWGDLTYVAGSGANVLTFVGPVTAVAGTQLRITGLTDGTVKNLKDVSFSWPEVISVSRTVDAYAQPPLSGGMYQISSRAHLLWFADRLATAPQSSAALTADIDLSDFGDFVPMGGSTGFRGIFDGRGHTISGLSLSTPNASGGLGFFGSIAEQGVVTNLVLADVSVSCSTPDAFSMGMVCGINHGTIACCSLSGSISTKSSANGSGSSMGGVCGINHGTVRDCCVYGPTDGSSVVLANRCVNMVVGGIVGSNSQSGTISGCIFYGFYDDYVHADRERGAISGKNGGTIRNCVGLHHNHNYFNGCVGSGQIDPENTFFLDGGVAFTGGQVCYILNGGVTDGSQVWYQAIGTDSLPRLSSTPVPGATVYFYGNTYGNFLPMSWKALQLQLNAGGMVTLEDDVAAQDGDSTLTVSGAVTLDLNGHTIDALGRVGVIKVLEGGHLTLTNSVGRGGSPGIPSCAITGGNADNGGGVHVASGGAFTMAGGEISGNTARSNGGGVYVASGGTFTVSGVSVVSGNTKVGGAANNVYLSSGEAIALGSLASGASIGVTTMKDPTAFEPITIGTGATVDDEAYFFSDGSAFFVECVDGSLCLSAMSWKLLQARLNAGGTVKLKIDVAAAEDDSSLTVTTAVTLDLNGHTLTHNGSGQVLSIDVGGDLTLTNSLAEGAVTGGGGGVYVGNSAVFRLQGGAIFGNASDYAGGGVFVDYGGEFTMTGGEICDNTADWHGGGVFVEYFGEFTMTGGEISGNTANLQGGGVYVTDGCAFTVSGSPVVADNTNLAGMASNIYLPPGKAIAVNGLSTGASVGVTTENAPTASTPVTIAVGASAGDETCFFSDDSSYNVERDGSTLLLAGGMSEGFTDPEGREIEDQAFVEWLSANNFTQSDINALGSDSAATDKLYECWLLNCSITAANPGGALSITIRAVRSASRALRSATMSSPSRCSSCASRR